MRNFHPLRVFVKVCAGASVLAWLVLAAPAWHGTSVQAQAVKHPTTAVQLVRFDPKFKTAPPEVESLEIEAIDRGRKTNNAKLTVTFTPSAPVEKEFSIRVGERTVLLRQVPGKAPRSFTGVVDFDFEAFAAEQARRADLAKKGVKVAIFDKRVLVREEPVQFVSPEEIRRGIFHIPPIVFHGVPGTVDFPRELMITDTSVVNDPGRTWDPCPNSGGSGPSGTPMGVWTFGFLMTQMANNSATGIDPSDFAQNWVNNWTSNQTVNSFTVPARNAPATGINELVTSTWPKLANGKLDLSQAPFRLLAIVNRVDLRQNLIYGGGSAGEGRFVFGWVDPTNCGSPPLFTVILEYGVPVSSCSALHSYAQEWANLGSIALGAPSFNDSLQMITDQFTLAGENPAKPNLSALDQLRTNELRLVTLPTPWELRQFDIVEQVASDLDSGQVTQFTVAQTPDLSFNATTALWNYENLNQAAIINGTYDVPLTFANPGPPPTPAAPFLGGNAPNAIPGVVWNGTPPSGQSATAHNVRLAFSVGTCSGCHQGETQFALVPGTAFLQIQPRPAGAAAVLSTFLTGETVTDPVDGTSQNTFNDLLRREEDLDSLLNSTCRSGIFLGGIAFRPLNMSD
jgi:hypothetical protein